MSTLRLTVTTGVVATVAALCAATASAVSDSSRCNLISARQLASVHVTGGGCAQKGPLPYLHYATFTSTRWGTIQRSHVVLSVYDIKPAYVGAARSAFDKDGTSVGIGDWSSFKGHANGMTHWSITFGKGAKMVDLEVATPPRKPLTSAKPFLALARSLAAKL